MKDDDISALTFDMGSTIGQHQSTHPQHEFLAETNDRFMSRMRKNFSEMQINGRGGIPEDAVAGGGDCVDDDDGDDDDNDGGGKKKKSVPQHHRLYNTQQQQQQRLQGVVEVDDTFGDDGRDRRHLMASLLKTEQYDQIIEGPLPNSFEDWQLKKKEKKQLKKEKKQMKKEKKSHKHDRKKDKERNSKHKDGRGDAGDGNNGGDVDRMYAMQEEAKRAQQQQHFPLKEIRFESSVSSSQASPRKEAAVTAADAAKRRGSFSIASTAETAESSHSRSGHFSNRRSSIGTSALSGSAGGGCGGVRGDFGVAVSSSSPRRSLHHQRSSLESNPSHEESHDNSLGQHTHNTHHTQNTHNTTPRSPHNHHHHQNTSSQLSHSHRSTTGYSTASSVDTSHQSQITYNHIHLLQTSLTAAHDESSQVTAIKQRLESDIQQSEQELSHYRNLLHELQLELQAATQEREKYTMFIGNMERENSKLRVVIGNLEERERDKKLDDVLDSMEAKMIALRSRRGGGGGGNNSGSGGKQRRSSTHL